MQFKNRKWFETWFDSPYYHLLYQHRNQEEASNFVNAMIFYLKPPQGAKVLDMACGAGRFAIEFAKHPIEVTGIDLSFKNIGIAQQYVNDHLQFLQHDMRLPYCINYFDYVFNLFTSFGYYGRKHDDLLVAKNMFSNLKKGGKLVFDFLNTAIIELHEDHIWTVEMDNIQFKTRKYIQHDCIMKEITVIDGPHKMQFYEQVRAYSKEQLESMFANIGFKVLDIKGSYSLEEFNPKSSNRVILILQK